MTITLDHTIVRSRDMQRSARFLADLLGLAVGEPSGPFVPVAINAELTFDFDERPPFAAGHYAFRLDAQTFDALAARLEQCGAEFGRGPGHGWDRQIEHADGLRRVYVLDADGHSYEFFCRSSTD